MGNGLGRDSSAETGAVKSIREARLLLFLFFVPRLVGPQVPLELVGH